MELVGLLTTVAASPISKSGIGASAVGRTISVGFNTCAYQTSRNAMEIKNHLLFFQHHIKMQARHKKKISGVI